MRHRARWIALAAGAVVTVLAVVLATQVGTDPRADANKSHLLGQNAPAVDLPTLDGGRIRSSDLAGKVVIVNFWNSWCIPCREEHPALKQFYARHAADPNVVLLGIVRDDTKAAAQRWVEAKGDDWTIATDPGGKASLAFGTRGQPETFAVSPDGLVMGYQFGPSSVEDLEQLLSAARGPAS
jgi:cytochrome c biogenesis protein CcmG, thiol:disulfide interchange protein DsbE